jgi:hypothetical protein
MKGLSLSRLLLLLLLSIFTLTSYAWNHSIELGYGYSHDPNHSKYNNSGFLLTSDMFPIYRNCWSFWSVHGSLGQWHTTAPVNKNLTTAAASLALRLYPFYVYRTNPAYLLATAGPAYLSKPRFGYNRQASHASIQTEIGLGAEFHPVDVNLRLTHYSNANLGHVNDGFNVLYLLSIGYLI